MTGLTTFGATVADAASGSGVANGIPFTFTRTGTGQYTYHFDPALLPIVATASALSQTGHAASLTSFGPGTFLVQTLANNAGANSGHFWTCTARDSRR